MSEDADLSRLGIDHLIPVGPTPDLPQVDPDAQILALLRQIADRLAAIESKLVSQETKVDDLGQELHVLFTMTARSGSGRTLIALADAIAAKLEA